MSKAEKPWSAADARIAIAKDLREIARMYAALHAEAVNRAGDPEIPGGAAMVMLGPGADLEAWGYYELSAIFGRLDLGDTDHKRKIELDEITQHEIEPPLSFLASWSDIVREARGLPPSLRVATIAGERQAILSSLDWMTSVDDDGVPWWMPIEDFQTQLHRVVRALEAALRDGKRSDRINAECRHCVEKPRLIVRRGAGAFGHDFWQCPNCLHVYDKDGVARCWRAMLVRRGTPPEWLTIAAASAALGRSRETVRRWAATGSIGSHRDDDGTIKVSWPDARERDARARRRGQYRGLSVES